MSPRIISASSLVCASPGCERKLIDHRDRIHDFTPLESDLDQLPRREYLAYRNDQRSRKPSVDPCWAIATRMAVGVTQQEVADDIGVHASLLCRWENGQTVPGSPGRARRWLWTIRSLEDTMTDQQRRKRDELFAQLRS